MVEETAVAGCCPFTSLPNEVLELILHSEQIDHVCLSKLSLVCRRLHVLISSNKIWNIQAKRRWNVWRYCGRDIRLKRNDSLDIPGVVEWRDLFVRRFRCERAVKHFLDEVADDYLLLEKDNGLVDDSKIEAVLVTPMEHEYVMETLRELADDGDCTRDFSHRFYAPSVYTYFKLKRLMLSFSSVFGEDLTSFCRSMEPISIWLDRWMNPLEDLEYFDYSIEFDQLADRARRVLPGASSSWDIVRAIDGVMFKEDGYRVNEHFYSHTNSYLHNVIRTKQGIYITLAVIFQAVASRLGLNLFPVSFPGSFALGYQEYHNTSLPSRTQFITFIEGNRVRRISDQELNFPQILINQSSFTNLSSVHIVTTRMLTNISLNLLNKEPNGGVDERFAFIRATELLLKLNKSIDRRIQLSLFNACNHLNYNLDKYSIKFNGERSVDKTLQHIRRRTHETDSEIQEYPIGLIVRMTLAPDLIGVVYKWNRRSNGSVSYSILLDNTDTDLDCTHEDLTPILTPHYTPIANPRIGKYFSQFNGHYYKPITQLRQIYPDDERVIQTLFSNL